jgi:hypothetical protein
VVSGTTVPNVSSMQVFTTQRDYDIIASSFPYLTNSSLATGGGQVPQLNFKPIPADGSAFDVMGVRIEQLPVHHGKNTDGVGAQKKRTDMQQ